MPPRGFTENVLGVGRESFMEEASDGGGSCASGGVDGGGGGGGDSTEGGGDSSMEEEEASDGESDGVGGDSTEGGGESSMEEEEASDGESDGVGGGVADPSSLKHERDGGGLLGLEQPSSSSPLRSPEASPTETFSSSMEQALLA